MNDMCVTIWTSLRVSGLFVPKSTWYRLNEQADSETDKTSIQNKSTAENRLIESDNSGCWDIQPVLTHLSNCVLHHYAQHPYSEISFIITLPIPPLKKNFSLFLLPIYAFNILEPLL